MAETEKQATIFLVIVAFIVLSLIGLYLLNLLATAAVLIVILVALILIYAKGGKFFTQLEQYERGVVFRMGRFKRVAPPGWLFVIPIIEYFKVMDMRVRTVDIKPQDVITKDNIKLMVDAIIYMKVIDAERAIIKVEDYEKAMVSYVQAHLRDVIGKMLLSNVISNISRINDILQGGLQKVGAEWGIKVDKVELQTIELPKEVIDAMHQRKAAEQLKLAQVEKAEARKITIDAIQAAGSKLTDPTLQYMYLQALQRMAEGKSTKFIFPMELSRLATGFAKGFGGGVSYEEAQEKLLKRYQKLSKDGKKPKTIIDTLRKEIAEETAAKKKKK